jgi:hypothetical protein
LWFETSHPDLEDARAFAEAIHAQFPGSRLRVVGTDASIVLSRPREAERQTQRSRCCTRRSEL